MAIVLLTALIIAGVCTVLTGFFMFVTWPQRKEFRYKHFKLFVLSFSTAIITLGAFLMFSGTSEMIVADDSYDVPDSLDTVEEIADWHITAELGQVTAENNDVIRELDYTSNGSAEDSHLKAHLTTEDNVTTDLIRTSTLHRSAQILQRLSQINDVDQIYLVWDIYVEPETGPGGFDTIFEMSFQEEKLNDIDWEDFDDIEQLEEVADDYWEKPALTGEHE